MKLYSLTNMYCEGVHAGIQCQHSTVRLLRKYSPDADLSWRLIEAVDEWAGIHETTILVAGGNHESMQEWLSDLNYWNEVPFAEFYEPGMNNCLTSISFVCSTDMVDDMAMYRRREVDEEQLNTKYGPSGASILMRLALARTV